MTALMATGWALVCLSRALLATAQASDESAGEACKAVTTGALLQRSKSGSSRAEQLRLGLVEDPTDTLALLMNLSEKVINSTYKLSTGEEDLLFDINITIENTTIPGLLEEQKQQQQMLEEAHQKLASCRETSKSKHKDFDDMTSKVNNIEKEHIGCRTEESELSDAQTKAWDALNGWVKTNIGGGDVAAHSFALPDLEHMPSVSSYLSGAQTTLEASKAEVERLSVTFEELWEIAENATKKHKASVQACNSFQSQYELGYCEWHETGLETNARYAECNRQIGELENASRHFNASETSRKNVWSSVRRVQCFMDVIAQTRPSEDMVTHCTTFAVDTSHLDLRIPENAENITAKMSPITGHDFEFMPGQPSWRSLHYANLTKDTPAMDTTACLHSVSCSDFTCTDGYKLKESNKELIPDVVSVDECCDPV